MSTYIVLCAEKLGYNLKTALIEKETYQTSEYEKEDYFPNGFIVQEMGEVEIFGDAEDSIPDVFVGE